MLRFPQDFMVDIRARDIPEDTRADGICILILQMQALLGINDTVWK